MREIWKPIPSLNNKIAASNKGRIKRLIAGGPWNSKAGHIYKPSLRKDGYLQINVLGKMKLIHCLVCEAFKGKKPSNKHECNHDDGNRSNNIPKNLEWSTSQENNLHRHRILKCKTNAKRYKVYPPTGEPFEIENLLQFCIQNNLTNSNMVEVVKGRQSFHKGWKIEYA